MISKEQARDLVGRIQARLDDAGDLILELYQGEGWKALGYTSWHQCVATEFGPTNQRDVVVLALAQTVLPQLRKEAKEALKNGQSNGRETLKKGSPHNRAKTPIDRSQQTQQRFRNLVGEGRRADNAITVSKHTDLAQKVEKQEMSLKEAAEIARERKAAKAVTKPADPHPELKAFEAEKLSIINAPSTYPIDAELPVHPTQGIHTRHIQEAIIGLRKEEPEIGKMTEGQLFKRIHPYTQRIQTYGKFGAEYHVRGPIDARFVEWAGDCFSKLRARQMILEKRRTMHERTPHPKRGLKRHTGDEFERLFKDVKRPFKNLLKPFPSQYEERIKEALLSILTEYFAEKREAHAKRLSLQTNGAKAP